MDLKADFVPIPSGNSAQTNQTDESPQEKKTYQATGDLGNSAGKRVIS